MLLSFALLSTGAPLSESAAQAPTKELMQQPYGGRPSASSYARSLTDDQLDSAISALLAEKRARVTSVEDGVTSRAPSDVSKFLYTHKKTYATADPIKAALFMQKYFGGQADKSPFQHHCKDASIEEPQTKNVYFGATVEQPHGFAVHFVRNPHKAPHASVFPNASALGLQIQQWRGSGWGTAGGGADRFDQFMDNHLGLVFESLDPLVALWQRDGIPFICRTWYCGPGMPQYEKGQCPGNVTNTRFGETGCYIEAPHGIVVEALCPLGDYEKSRACLTSVDPRIFDLCSASR